MSAPEPPREPWYPPTAPFPQGPPAKRRMNLTTKVTLGVLGGLVFCVGGLAGVGALVGGGPDRPAATIATDGDKAALGIAEAPASSSSPAAAPAVTTPIVTETVEPVETAKPIATTPAVRHTSAGPEASTSKPKPTATTKKPRPKPTTKAPATGAVHPGAFCKPEGSTGHTAKGTLMRCTRKAGEDQPRWRAA